MKKLLAITVVSAVLLASAACDVPAAGMASAVPGTSEPSATQDIEIVILSPAPTATPEQTAAPTETTAPAPTPAAKPKAKAAESSAKASPELAKAASAGMSATEQIRAEAEKFRVQSGKYYGSYGFSSNHYAYTASELRMLAIVVHLEARGESYYTKIAVANVVMNRVLSPGYPGATIQEVVTRPNQFCYNPSVTPTAECVRAARDVLDHEVWVVPQNTYFFRMTKSKSNWGSHEYWGHFGTEAFYQDRYAGRFNGSAVPAKLYDRVYKWPQYGCKPAARVRKIQAMLKGLGYGVAADGYFGSGTKREVIKFQKDNGLKADGIAGPATLRKLIGKYGLSKYQKLK